MNIYLLGLIVVSVACSAFAQMALKTGMSDAAVQAALAAQNWPELVWRSLINVYTVSGLGLYGLSVMMWLLVLARIDVSVAYPFVGLGFILTMVLGAVLLHEPVGLMRVVGTLLVAVGVVLISRS